MSSVPFASFATDNVRPIVPCASHGFTHTLVPTLHQERFMVRLSRLVCSLHAQQLQSDRRSPSFSRASLVPCPRPGLDHGKEIYRVHIVFDSKTARFSQQKTKAKPKTSRWHPPARQSPSSDDRNLKTAGRLSVRNVSFPIVDIIHVYRPYRMPSSPLYATRKVGTSVKQAEQKLQFRFACTHIGPRALIRFWLSHRFLWSIQLWRSYRFKGGFVHCIYMLLDIQHNPRKTFEENTMGAYSKPNTARREQRNDHTEK